MKKFEEMFKAESDRLGEGYKTGYFHGFRDEKQYALAEEKKCECLGAGLVEIDWYMTRSAKREPVIRVKWFFPTYASRKVYSNGYCFNKKTWGCAWKEQKFPFTVEGLEAAMKFTETL